MLTIQQHILQELQANEPLNIKNILTALKQKQIEITSIELKQAIDKLISDGWVEYYELIDTTLGYELCNRWYNLEESKRNKILGE